MEICKNPRKRDGQSKQTWNILKKVENASGILSRLSPLLAFSCLSLPPQNLSFPSKIIETKDCRGPRFPPSQSWKTSESLSFWVSINETKGSQRIRLSETLFSEDFPNQNPCFHRFTGLRWEGLFLLRPDFFMEVLLLFFLRYDIVAGLYQCAKFPIGS